MDEVRDDREDPEETIKLFREVQKEDLFFVNRSGAGSAGNAIKVVQRLIIVLISTGVGVTITSKVVPGYESEAIALFLIIVATIFLFYCIEVAGILWANLRGVSIEMDLGLLDIAKKSRHFKDFRNDYKAEGEYGKLLNASANFFLTPQILEKGKRFRSIWILLYFVSYIVFSFIGVILLALLVNSNVLFFLNLPVDLVIFSAIWLLYLWIVPLLLIRVYLLSFNDLANILTYLKN